METLLAQDANQHSEEEQKSGDGGGNKPEEEKKDEATEGLPAPTTDVDMNEAFREKGYY